MCSRVPPRVAPQLASGGKCYAAPIVSVPVCSMLRYCQLHRPVCYAAGACCFTSVYCAALAERPSHKLKSCLPLCNCTHAYVGIGAATWYAGFTTEYPAPPPPAAMTPGPWVRVKAFRPPRAAADLQQRPNATDIRVSLAVTTNVADGGPHCRVALCAATAIVGMPLKWCMHL